MQTDNSLIDELVQPRPVGVPVLWPTLPKHPPCWMGEPGQPWETDCVQLPMPSQQQACKDGYLWEARKSGYYFKRNSHRKNVGFKINK